MISVQRLGIMNPPVRCKQAPSMLHIAVKIKAPYGNYFSFLNVNHVTKEATKSLWIFHEIHNYVARRLFSGWSSKYSFLNPD